jgi:hypothetical protein
MTRWDERINFLRLSAFLEPFLICSIAAHLMKKRMMETISSKHHQMKSCRMRLMKVICRTTRRAEVDNAEERDQKLLLRPKKVINTHLAYDYSAHLLMRFAFFRSNCKSNVRRWAAWFRNPRCQHVFKALRSDWVAWWLTRYPFR